MTPSDVLGMARAASKRMDEQEDAAAWRDLLRAARLNHGWAEAVAWVNQRPEIVPLGFWPFVGSGKKPELAMIVPVPPRDPLQRPRTFANGKSAYFYLGAEAEGER